MDKKGLVSLIASNSNYTRAEVAEILSATIKVLNDTLQRGEEVNLNGFGSFKFKHKKGRTLIHPISRKPTVVEDKVSVTFTSTKKFKILDSAKEKLMK